jgi:hypothetical protein
MLADKITKKVPDARVDVITLVAQMGKEIAESDALTTFKASLSPNASLTVEGWAEGKDEANLSTDAADARARQVTQAISGIPSKIVSSKKNVAWMKALHNDSTNPEGRMYNRAVRVEVRTAVQ